MNFARQTMKTESRMRKVRMSPMRMEHSTRLCRFSMRLICVDTADMSAVVPSTLYMVSMAFLACSDACSPMVMATVPVFRQLSLASKLTNAFDCFSYFL